MKLNIEYKNVVLNNDFRGQILNIIKDNLLHFQNLKITEDKISIDIEDRYFWRYFYRFIEASFIFIPQPYNFDIKNVIVSNDKIDVFLDILE